MRFSLRSIRQLATGQAQRDLHLSALQDQGDRSRDAGQWSAAAESYEAVLKLRPDDYGLRVQAGHMRKEMGDFDKAERHYLIARAEHPEDADLALQMGHFYKVAARPHEAFSAYRRAVALDAPGDDARRELVESERRVRGLLGVPAQTIENAAASEADLAETSRQLTVQHVRESGLFDAAWYLKRYPDVARLGLDPVEHFTIHGRLEGRLAGPRFDAEWYGIAHPEVARTGLDPFTHYLVVGREKGLQPLGPPPYQRWVDLFDTLSTADLADIAAHVESGSFVRPDVLLAVDATNVAFLSRAIHGLRAQLLAPASVRIIVDRASTDDVLPALTAIVGSDRRFTIVQDGDGADPFRTTEDAPLILMDAAIELREHALYMMVLSAGADGELVYADHDHIDRAGFRTQPFFKPGVSPELMRQTNYAGACILLPAAAGGMALEHALLDGETSVTAAIRDQFLATAPQAIRHVPFVLYHDHDDRDDITAALPVRPRIEDGSLPTVSIIIPTRDYVALLSVCIESILDRTDYPMEKIDIIVVDNGSVDPETLDYLRAGSNDGRFRVLHAPFPFNYPRLNNMAADASQSEILVLLNNDTEVQDPAWLRALVHHAMIEDVGAVGPKLLYEDGTIQHAGVVLGVGAIAAHAHLGIGFDAPGAYGFAQRTREVAAVTGACLAMRRAVFDRIGGLDEKLPVAFNDVNLCLASLEHGYRNLYVHDVWIRHFESKTRGIDDTFEKVDVFVKEAKYARGRYPGLFRCDPWYSPNLSLDLEKFYEPAFPPRIAYPWRQEGRALQRPAVLLLASVAEAHAEIATTVAIQARYLSDQGYDVTVGRTREAASLARGCAHEVVLATPQAAAIHAVSHRIDCVVIHTANYAGTARWLGSRPAVVIYHHGSDVAEADGADTSRSASIDLQLCLPIVDGIVATSAEAAAEVADARAIVLAPGGDDLGVWSDAAQAARASLRRARGWTDRIVILIATRSRMVSTDERDDLAALAAQLDITRIALVLTATDLVGGDLPAGVEYAGGDDHSLFDMLVATDIFYSLGNVPVPLLRARAQAAGVRILTSPETDRSAKDIAGRMAAIAAELQGVTVWSRRAQGVRWGDTLQQFDALLGDIAVPVPVRPVRTPLGLLSPHAVVEQSGLFDASFYRAANPDLSGTEQELLNHFLLHGGTDGRRPSIWFHTDWYLAQNSVVARSGVNPLLHYLTHPSDDVDPNPYFCNRACRESLTDRELSEAPLVRYLRRPKQDKPETGPNFDAAFYSSVYADVRESGEDAFAHFLRVGEPEGRLPIRPVLSAIDLFDDGAVRDHLGTSGVAALPRKVSDGRILDAATATRFLIDLVRSRPDLRARFPVALSAGADGPFAAWIAQAGEQELGLSPAALSHIANVFRHDPAERVRQVYLLRPELRLLHPLALLPEGAGDMLRWGAESGISEDGITLDGLWWFLLANQENPAAGLVLTYRFNPSWQRQFPDGLTMFGRDRFAAWLQRTYGLNAEWVKGAWPTGLSVAEEIRLAYRADPSWQKARPDPFGTPENARLLLAWLATAEADIPERAARQLAVIDHDVVAAELVRGGINMMGHFGYASGLRTSTEALVEGYRRTGARVSERDVWVQYAGDDNRHAAYGGLEIYDTTVIHAQPEPLFDTAYRRAGLAERTPRTTRVGYWYWELDTVPEHWRMQADQVDEIWTATRFVGDALRARFDIPVTEILPGLELPKVAPLPRSYFGLPDDKFLFLFTFHMVSIMERKNPLGLIEAFVRAFRPSEAVCLVLKTSFGDQLPAQMAELRRAAAGHNIVIIDSVYSKDDVLSLMNACDSYISLHRSEGYGLTMAEAMLIGKPTIATGYSGNLDFMTPQTSLLVDHDLVTLTKDHGPYRRGTRWAQPSLKHAGESMRKVFENQEWARTLGDRGRADLKVRMSYETSGKRIADRLAAMRQERAMRIRRGN